jgi:hypothetical protein
MGPKRRRVRLPTTAAADVALGRQRPLRGAVREEAAAPSAVVDPWRPSFPLASDRERAAFDDRS